MKLNKLLMALMLVAGAAQADNEMAYLANRAGGAMFFTYSPCVYLNSGERIPDKFYVYSTDSTGAKISDGCYAYKYPFYIIQWNRGGNTNINVNSVTSLVKS